MRRAGVFIVIFAACGGAQQSATSSSTTRPETGQTAPAHPTMLLGRPVWDGPISDPMSLRALERVRTALADQAPQLHGADPRMWLGPVQGWIETRVKLTKEVRADAEALATDADPRMQLLSSVVISVAADDFVTDLLSIEPPPEFGGEHSAEIKSVFREALEQQAAPLTASARAALAKCVAAAPRAPEALRGWEAFCRERDASLGELEARVAARGAPAPRK